MVAKRGTIPRHSETEREGGEEGQGLLELYEELSREAKGDWQWKRPPELSSLVCGLKGMVGDEQASSAQ